MSKGIQSIIAMTILSIGCQTLALDVKPIVARETNIRSLLALSSTTGEVIVQRIKNGNRVSFERCHVPPDFFNQSVAEATEKLRVADCFFRTDALPVRDDKTLGYINLAIENEFKTAVWDRNRDNVSRAANLTAKLGAYLGGVGLTVALAGRAFTMDCSGGSCSIRDAKLAARANWIGLISVGIEALAAIYYGNQYYEKLTADLTLERMWDKAKSDNLGKNQTDLKLDPKDAMDVIWEALSFAVLRFDKA